MEDKLKYPERLRNCQCSLKIAGKIYRLSYWSDRLYVYASSTPLKSQRRVGLWKVKEFKQQFEPAY